MSNGSDTFREWVDKWIQPTTVMVAIGAIIWGVQLNVAILQTGATNTQQSELLAELAKKQQAMEIQLAQTAILLDHITQRLTDNTQRVLEHDKELAAWERKMLLLEQTVRNNTPTQKLEQ